MSMPEIDAMLIDVPHLVFNDPDGNKYVQTPYRSVCAVAHIPAPGKNYAQVLSVLPDGFHISSLDEVEHLLQCGETLRKGGKNTREALNEPLFARQVKGDPYLWLHSNVALCAPEGRDVIPVELYNGRKVGIADYKVGERYVAREIRVPVSRGGKVTAMNRVLRIPVGISDGNEPQHTLHWFFDPEHYDEKKEVAVQLDGDWCNAVHNRCLHLTANVGRSFSHSPASFRLVQGSIDDVPLPTVGYVRKGVKAAKDDVEARMKQDAARIASQLAEFSAGLNA